MSVTTVNPDKSGAERLYIGMKDGNVCRAVLITFRATHGLPPDPDLVAAPGVPQRADGKTEGTLRLDAPAPKRVAVRRPAKRTVEVRPLVDPRSRWDLLELDQ